MVDPEKAEETVTPTDLEALNGIDRDAQERLGELLETFESASRHMMGYPVNLDYDYSALLPFLRYSANNVGDPFHDSNYASNTHEIEREVIGTFADMMRLPRDQAWGYVTSGGTEGNMYGLYMGRETFPDGVVYFSQDTHYSVVKILRLLKARNIMIKSQVNGEIDYDDLYETIRINRDVPVIFMANIGTTMKGAIDDVNRVRDILDDLAVSNFYIHADAALSGMILPFVDDPQPHGFDSGFDSVAVSGHKMIGSPLPCGVALTRRENVARIARAIEYVGVLDTTLTGSRNALTPIMMWYAFERHGLDGFKRIVTECLETAEYAVNRFTDSGIPAWRNKNSVTVVFPKPSAEVISKWQLAPYGDIAHLITMPQVTRETIDAVVDDCLKP
jgi:histidine decarboxylase